MTPMEFYLGISHGNIYYQTAKKNEHYLRINGILAAHAILYVSQRYREAMSFIGKYCLNTLNKPWDVGTAGIQHQFRSIHSKYSHGISIKR
jgi:hypothetical protein